MSDFLKAFAEGIEAAKAIHNNKSEISLRISEFSRSLKIATSSKLELDFELHEKSHDYQIFGIPAYRVMAFNPSFDPNDRVCVANWKEDRNNGYPCQLDDGANVWVCNNILEVENAFAEFVRSPANALRFLDVMNKN